MRQGQDHDKSALLLFLMAGDGGIEPFDGDMEVLDLEQRGAHAINPITTTGVGEIACGVFWCPLRIPLTSAL